MTKPGGKLGPIKRQHGRVEGLDQVLDRILNQCPHVTRIVPGRMGRKRGKTTGGGMLRFKYLTTGTGDAPQSEAQPTTGLKCIYTHAGSWQEVFFVCSDAAAARDWITERFNQK